MTADETGDTSVWSRQQDKAFENALATYTEDTSDRWEKIAGDVPGKSLEEVKHHYEHLVDDISRIESGSVPLPCYDDPSNGSTSLIINDGACKKSAHLGNINSESNHGSKASRSDQERRKGIAWTEEEHRLFLLGLEKYGKGDWRSISRNFVVTRTPTQVASHAQKYFIRLNSMNKERRRSSIHDITSVSNGDVSLTQGPITGDANGSAAGTSGKPNKPPSQNPPTATPGVGIYAVAPTIGQPVGPPLVSAVGTPVNLAVAPAATYGVRAVVPMVPGGPVKLAPMAYNPMPHNSANR